MALQASSSHDMQLAEHIESIKMRTERLSIAEDPCQIVTEEHYQFINKAKQQINYFTQLLREVLNGSLKKDSVASLDVDILDIHWNRRVKDESQFAKGASQVTGDSSLCVEDFSQYAKRMKDRYGYDVIVEEDVYIGVGYVEPRLPTLEEEMQELIDKSYERIDQLLMSDEYFSIHDDLKALEEEQRKWLWLEISGFDCSEFGSDSDHEGVSDPMLGLAN